MYNHDDHHVHNDEVSMMINMLRTQPTARPPHIQVRMATVPHMVPASPSAGISSGSHGSQVLIYGPHMALPWVSYGPHVVSHEDFTISLSCSPNHGLT